jgi:hypothetical protein
LHLQGKGNELNYQVALEKLEQLLNGYKKKINIAGAHSTLGHEELIMLYGEVEEVITRFAGVTKVEVPSADTNFITEYPNFIAARLLSNRTFYSDEGYTQLLKVIGKVRQHAEDPGVPKVEYSFTHVIQVLRRFRECCQYLSSPLIDEGQVQGIAWIMLRSHFDRLEKEATLPRFGIKSYRPDFGIPDLRVLIESKFIGPKTNVASIQEEILGDVPGYLNEATDYDSIIVFVYDAAQQLRDSRKFIEDLKSIDGIIEVIVVPGIG